jgi:hypothetical protein
VDNERPVQGVMELAIAQDCRLVVVPASLAGDGVGSPGNLCRLRVTTALYPDVWGGTLRAVSNRRRRDDAKRDTIMQEEHGAVAIAEREIAIDLHHTDIDAILDCVRSLPGQWGAKLIRSAGLKCSCEANWGYVFPRGQVDDIMPTISITRTSDSYMVVSWDLFELAAEGAFAQYCAQTIGDVLAIVRDIVWSLSGANTAAYAGAR